MLVTLPAGPICGLVLYVRYPWGQTKANRRAPGPLTPFFLIWQGFFPSKLLATNPNPILTCSTLYILRFDTVVWSLGLEKCYE